MRQFTLPLAALGLAGLILASCGEGAAEPRPASTPPSTPVAAEAPAAAESVVAAEPQSTKPLPSFVVLPPGAKVISQFTFANAQRKGGTLLVATSASDTETLAYLRQSMATGDLQMGPEITGKRGETTLTAQSPGGKRNFQISVHPAKGDRAMLHINYHEPVS